MKNEIILLLLIMVAGTGGELCAARAMQAAGPAAELHHVAEPDAVRLSAAFDRFVFQRVENRGNKRSHWVARAPLGMSVEWDAEIITDHTNEAIAINGRTSSPQF